MNNICTLLTALCLIVSGTSIAQRNTDFIFQPKSSNCAVSITNSSQTNVSCNSGNDGTIDISVLLDTAGCRSNTVALNEVMYKPILRNGLDPNTGEFIELIAPAGTNIGCYVLTDGDWTITIPPGTTVPADGLFSIGNNAVYGAGFFDLDAETCACSTEGSGGGETLLILTDRGEYISLHNNTGAFIQGLQYSDFVNSPGTSAANIPPNGARSVSGTISTAALAGCPAQVTIPTSASFDFVALNPATPNGDSYQRIPDGSGAWSLPTGNTINDCNASSNAVYSVVWSNGTSTEDIANLSAGVYTVTVTDGNGCEVLDTFTISEPTAVTISTTSVTSTSCGAATGAIQILPAGGIAPYNFLWSNNSTTRDISGLSAGVYNLSLTDANGCETDYTQTVSNPSAPTLTLSSSNVLCNSDATGSATVSAAGGTAPLSILWSNSETTSSISGLIANNYFVTVTDALGCVAAGNIAISQPNPLTTTAVQTNDVSCFGFNNGGVNVAPAGGVPNYSFLWSNGATSQLVQNLPPSSYAVTITDANGCTIVRLADVLEPSPLLFPIHQLSDTLGCDLTPNGQLSAQVAGGTGAYSYIWFNTTQTTATISGLDAGRYTVTVSDANGCTITGNYEVFVPLTVSVNAIIDSFNSKNAVIKTGQSLNFSLQNPISNQSYNWTIAPSAGFSLGNSIGISNSGTSNTAGQYQLVISATTANNCSDTDTLNIEVINPFLGMPSAFSPNGDGLNEIYRPVSLDAQYIKEFKIFNRWGGLLYDSPSLENGGWNGEQSGQAQPRDVYIYLINYQLPNETAVTLRGEFTLLR